MYVYKVKTTVLPSSFAGLQWYITEKYTYGQVIILFIVRILCIIKKLKEVNFLFKGIYTNIIHELLRNHCFLK